MDYFHLQREKDDVSVMSNLGLAYLGDAVFELMVRSHLCLQGKLTSGKLNKAALRYVTAPAKAAMAGKILPQLTQEEEQVYRRGRNAKVNSIPKSATREEYQSATALETLFGFLYLRGEQERLNQLFSAMIVTQEEGI